MTFRQKEKERYRLTKKDLAKTHKIFSVPSISESGAYNAKGGTKPVEFYLKNNLSENNLFKDIRESAINYFKHPNRNIKWHHSRERHLTSPTKPSAHLCCSQSACVNSLFYLSLNSNLLNQLFRTHLMKTIYPDFRQVLCFRNDTFAGEKDTYISFEYIGENAYLPGESRTRGANCTSADFSIMFENKDGSKHLILGEWKYTEYYDKSTNPKISNTYKKPFKNIKDKMTLNNIEYKDVFFEPFYQLFRLQLLANEMELKKELGVDTVSVLHICPKANTDFLKKITSKKLIRDNLDVHEVWKNIAPINKFSGIYFEDLRNEIIKLALKSKHEDFGNYLKYRYDL